MNPPINYRKLIVANVVLGLLAAVSLVVEMSLDDAPHPWWTILMFISVIMFLVCFGLSFCFVVSVLIAYWIQGMSKTARACLLVPLGIVCFSVGFAYTAHAYDARPDFFRSPTFIVSCLAFGTMLGFIIWLVFEDAFIPLFAEPSSDDKVEEFVHPYMIERLERDTDHGAVISAARRIEVADLNWLGWILLLAIVPAMIALAFPLVNWINTLVPKNGAKHVAKLLAIPLVIVGLFLFFAGIRVLKYFGIRVFKDR